MTGLNEPWPRGSAIRRLLMALMLIGLAWLCSPSPAAAQTCTATATDMAFGVVQTANNAGYSTTATIQVSCTSYSGAVQLRLCPFIGGGTYVAGANGPRRLGFNEYRLDFDVFVTSGQAIRYPNDTTSASTPATIINVPNGGTPSTANIVIYGGIPANQTGAALGAYSATLSSRLNYGPTSTFTSCTSTNGRSQTSFSFEVTATNSPSCTVSTAPVAFGAVSALTAAVDAAGSIGVKCSSGASYTVALNGGANGGTSATTRAMASGSNRITYGLYRDSGRSQGWYSDSGGTVSGTGSGATQTLPVYGRVPVQKTPPAGTYTDTVVVTLTY